MIVGKLRISVCFLNRIKRKKNYDGDGDADWDQEKKISIIEKKNIFWGRLCFYKNLFQTFSTIIFCAEEHYAVRHMSSAKKILK